MPTQARAHNSASNEAPLVQVTPPPVEAPNCGFLEEEDTELDPATKASEESTEIHGNPDPHPILVVERGVDRGRQFTIGIGQTTIGRSLHNDVILTDTTVSRMHLVLERDQDKMALSILDVGSGNGTRIDGKVVRRAQLAGQERVEVGQTVLRIQRAGGISASQGTRNGAKGDSVPGDWEDVVSQVRKISPLRRLAGVPGVRAVPSQWQRARHWISQRVAPQLGNVVSEVSEKGRSRRLDRKSVALVLLALAMVGTAALFSAMR